jgi:hypothetical protein
MPNYSDAFLENIVHPKPGSYTVDPVLLAADLREARKEQDEAQEELRSRHQEHFRMRERAKRAEKALDAVRALPKNPKFNGSDDEDGDRWYRRGWLDATRHTKATLEASLSPAKDEVTE